MDRHNYTSILTQSVDKKIKAEYVKVRAAKTGNNPPLIVSIPRPIANQLNLEIGDTFAMYIEGNNKIILTRATI